MSNTLRKFSIHTSNKKNLDILLKKDYKLEYTRMLDVHIIKLTKLISYNGNNLKDVYEELLSNKENLQKLEYYYDNQLIIDDIFLSPKTTMNISYYLEDFNKEILELSYLTIKR